MLRYQAMMPRSLLRGISLRTVEQKTLYWYSIRFHEWCVCAAAGDRTELLRTVTFYGVESRVVLDITENKV